MSIFIGKHLRPDPTEDLLSGPDSEAEPVPIPPECQECKEKEKQDSDPKHAMCADDDVK
jgi:hypothetical protein